MKFDIIGDIHGCYEELMELIERLGYELQQGIPIHPEGRQLVFVGDAMDRGPYSLKTLEFLFSIQDAGMLRYSPGNHCNKLYRYAKGNQVKIAHGLETTVAELDTLSTADRQLFLQRYRDFYEALPLFQQLDGGQLIVAHAGILEDMIHAPLSNRTRVFVLYGDITGETLPDGRPVRRDWTKRYHGKSVIVYGHTPVPRPRFTNNTVNIDTGCIFGGQLTALRYPEMDWTAVPSRQPFLPEKFTYFDCE